MIKIIAGVYGYKENGIILPKDKDSEPFSLDPEREAELVTQGVAEYANVIIPEVELEPEPEGLHERHQQITVKHGRWQNAGGFFYKRRNQNHENPDRRKRNNHTQQAGTYQRRAGC